MHTDTQAQMEALGVGVTKGLMAPNEGRLRLGLSPVDGGDMPLVQQQMIPVNLAASGEATGIGFEAEPESEPEPEPDDEPISEAAFGYAVRAHFEEIDNAA